MNQFYINDTIVAISTAFGKGAISIIRLSGKQAISIASQIFKHSSINLKEAPFYKLIYGNILNPRTKENIDEVLIVTMPNGRSFTLEEMVEIHCHGGQIISQEIIKILLYLGARLAEAGEFTRRAYLNGRIDLTQAEAIQDLITARNLSSLKIALSHLEKRFSLVISNFKKSLLEILAHLEVLIDYPEENLEEFLNKKYIFYLKTITQNIDQILSDSKNGRVLKEGLKIALVGKTNVGKSSLFNFLFKEERAIVSEIHGTTRDFLESDILLAGIPVQIIDTAGIRETSNKIEQLGKNFTLKIINEVDFILFMLDNSRKWDKDDEKILKHINNLKHKQVIVIINKIDLISKLDLKSSLKEVKIQKTFKISLLKKDTLKNFENDLKEIFIGKDFQINNQTIICNIRHECLLKQTKKLINKVLDGIYNNLSYEFISLDLREVLNSLGEITGEITNDDILTQIFNNFCVGK